MVSTIASVTDSLYCLFVCIVSYAEMSPSEKNPISHRGRSLDLMKKYFAEHPNALQMTESETSEPEEKKQKV